MTEIDDRIVSMKFDNATFEQKLGDTIKSLDKLRQSLDFAASTKGFTDLNSAAQKVDMTPMGTAVDGLSAKFIAMSTIAITVLSQIVGAALNAGRQISSSLTITPVLQGFAEYETNMNSIQTILANTDAKGTTLEQVNAALDQLNTYSDQTIYNFSEMARNIGTFTAAGVDLDTSVMSIKGIANLAAISGSNSQQAATAMYQLSQALATGTVKLIDWNSVVNAGMGGEVFQRALFETGKSLSQIEGANLDTTFDEWTAAGNSFRGSLEQGWLTAEVLTATLSGFTGDLNEAQLMALGFTQEQAAEMMRLGALGTAAATEVKTFTQLMQTVKEGIASGWSQSFRIIIGDFVEAKALFTNISNAVGGFFTEQAEHRNEMLNAWKSFGGRDALLEGFRNALEAIKNIIEPIAAAFRNFFPAMTAERLLDITNRFRDFTARIRDLTEKYAPQLGIIFKGFFAALDIGWEIIKGVAGVIRDIFGELVGATSGPILGFLTNIATFFIDLQRILVQEGGIQKFFRELSNIILQPEAAIQRLKKWIDTLFDSDGIPGGESASGVLDRIREEFASLGGVVDWFRDIWERLGDRFGSIIDVLEEVWTHLSTWFGELGNRLATAFSENDFDPVLDVINAGLLGGIIVLLQRFLQNGFSLDLTGGFMNSLRSALDSLTGTLENMQAQLRSRTLMNIAIAIGILAASMVALSLLDSDKLGQAMAATAIGLGQLVGAMAIMSTSGFGVGAARASGLATAMVIMAAALGLLSIAVTNMSQLSLGDMAQGMIGIAAGLAILVTGLNFMAGNTTGIMRAAIALIPMAIALRLLQEAVQEFSQMEWESMAQGLVGIGIALGVITTAMNFMPTAGMVAAGAGIILIAAGLRLLQEAVQAFSEMEWEAMGQGLVGIAGGLAAVVVAMNFMPTGMVGSAAAILIVSAALFVMAQAVEAMGNIPFGEMAKGIGAFAVMLGILAVAMWAMTGTAAGAGSLLVVSAALVILTEVLERLSQLSIGELAIALGAIAGVFLVLGISALLLAPLAPALLSLAQSIALVGAAFALFGVGAYLVAKAFQTIAEAGEAGITALIGIINVIIEALPRFAVAVVRSLINAGQQLLEAAGPLLVTVRELVIHILETVQELSSEITDTFVIMITDGLRAMRRLGPEFMETGAVLLSSFLEVIERNIHQFVTAGTNILTNLGRGLIDNMSVMVDTAVQVITTFLTELALRTEEIVAAGLTLLTAFISGIADNIFMVTDAIALLITTILFELANAALAIVDAGFQILVQFLAGIVNNVILVVDTVFLMIARFVLAVHENIQMILDVGFFVLTEFLRGIGDHMADVVTTVGTIITTFITEVGGRAVDIATAGANALVDFLNGIAQDIPRVAKAAADVIIAFVTAIGEEGVRIVDAGFEVLIDFLNGIADAIDENAEELRDAGRNIAGAIIDGLTGGLASRAGDVARSVASLANPAIGAFEWAMGIGGPSKVFCRLGQNIAESLFRALHEDTSVVTAAKSLAEDTIESFNNILGKIPVSVQGLDDFSPTITPILDLTKVEAESRRIASMMAVSAIAPEVSVAQARTISTTTEVENPSESVPVPEVNEITYIQNNYSPEALSTNDIYRNTKSQLAVTKEELGI